MATNRTRKSTTTPATTVEANPTPEVEAPKAEAPKAPKPRAAQKLVWTDVEAKDANGCAPAIGTRNGNVYAITRGDDGKWSLTHAVEGVDGSTTLAEGLANGHIAWRKAVDHHNANYIAPVVEAAEATEVA